MRVNVENNGLIDDILRFSSHLISNNINALSDLLEVEELLAWDFFEDGPRLCIIMQVIQSELQRSSSHNSLS
jgi:hypothetical protein